MAAILIVDTVGESFEAVSAALTDGGWDVAAGEAATFGSASADAIVLATDAAGFTAAQQQLQLARGSGPLGIPVLLVIDLDRSGWDRTFGSAEALNVEALLDKPVDAAALVSRLTAIQAARAAAGARGPPASGGAGDAARAGAPDEQLGSIIDRAVANEEAAAAFYRRAAESVSDPVSQEALESLMRDEEEHKRLLEEFRSGDRTLPEGHTDTGAIVESFGVPDFTETISPADAFLLAANKEKLAVDMYENWAKLYPAGPERELLEGLAEVERRHKAKVEAMFTNAAFPEAW